ncbi:MAG TPA: aminotransferase class V-fold PLP-dependent enzyme [Gemmataceae bacterium]|jgi:aspartate aminotransferase-like enzyme|nr:aminotransferase class V-fold PLP-dependent enzyme [Gemmataceae bacterium]
MLKVGHYTFKRAETPQELEQIHRLNFRTFVNEIPQHPDPGNGHLVDKYHDKNAYFIVVQDGQVLGMVSSHDQPPFSVASRLENPEILDRVGNRPLEVRLLAIEPEKRNSMIFFGLLWSLYEFAELSGYTHILISGLRERAPLYRRLGFEPLGPAVSSGGAWFIPMVLTVGKLPKKMEHTKQLWETHVDRESNKNWHEGNGASCRLEGKVCLLPGPVALAPGVHDAFNQPPIYHRGPEFISLFGHVRQTLGNMVGGMDVALFNGSGTLGNEALAATLAADINAGRGIMLVNGEFGERLARQATRFSLNFKIMTWPWGQPWNLDEVAQVIDQGPDYRWVWGVHLESSTGVLNDLPGLVRLAKARGVRVCMDCISSLGAVPLNLRDVFLATGATGKSLGSYAGLAIVFAKASTLAGLEMNRVPSYLDIPATLASEGPRFTFPSSTVRALEAALSAYNTPEKAEGRYHHYASLGVYVRGQLRQLGLVPIADDGHACPVITTFAPPGESTSADFVARCQSWGFDIGGQSQYLAERRFVQIATMGAVRREDCEPLFRHLAHWLEKTPASFQPSA